MKLDALDAMFKEFILAIVLAISIVFYGGYLFYKSLQPQIIESRAIILPKIKLETEEDFNQVFELLEIPKLLKWI